MNIKKLHNRKAFTLVEMLIVVVIIGILASALIPRLTGAQSRARDAARQGHLNQINTALSVYFNDKGAYPGNGCTVDLKGTLSPQYIKNIPSDPQSQRKVIFGNSGSKICDQGGSYGVLPIKRSGATAGGVVVAANTESQGKNSNFVLYNGGTNTPSNMQSSTDCNGNDALECITPDVEGNKLDEGTCGDGVQIHADGPSGTASGCFPSGNSEGTALTNAAMIYITTK